MDKTYSPFYTDIITSARTTQHPITTIAPTQAARAPSPQSAAVGKQRHGTRGCTLGLPEHRLYVLYPLVTHTPPK